MTDLPVACSLLDPGRNQATSAVFFELAEVNVTSSPTFSSVREAVAPAFGLLLSGQSISALALVPCVP